MNPIPCIDKTGPTARLMVDGEPFIMLSGEIHNSSSSHLDYLAQVLDCVVQLQCNSVIAPVYWELLEPEEGCFDFALVDGLLAAARQRGLRLALLWFGTWKNTYSSYTPEWVKTETSRFPRAETAPGATIGAISAWSGEACLADSHAFASLMRHLRAVDSEQRTVIAVQVQNETGMLGASRDHYALAEMAFRQPVPEELICALLKNRDALHPAVQGALQSDMTAGSWMELFGEDADEIFMAWQIAGYVQRVAHTGRHEYALPMFANAWLVQHPDEKAGHYPSGGPVSRMIDIWRIAAPDIELLAPDIYIEDFAGVCAEYDRPGNPLFIPEARRDLSAAAHALYAIGQHNALCFAPFGIEDMGNGHEEILTRVAANATFGMKTEGGQLLAETYSLLRGLLPLIHEQRAAGSVAGILQSTDASISLELGDYQLNVHFLHPLTEGRPPAGGIVFTMAPNEYVIAGFGFRVEFVHAAGKTGHVDFLELWEGDYLEGVWIPGRRLNGDEYAVWLGNGKPEIRRAKLYSYD